MIGKVTSNPAASLTIVTGSIRPPIDMLATTGAIPAGSEGRPRLPRSANGRLSSAKRADCEPSFGLWASSGCEDALAIAVVTRLGSMVGVVPVNVDVGRREGMPPVPVIVALLVVGSRVVGVAVVVVGLVLFPGNVVVLEELNAE